MKSFLQYLAGALIGIGVGILGTYYMGLSGQYVQSTALLTTLVLVIGFNFIVLGIIGAVWCMKKYRDN